MEYLVTAALQTSLSGLNLWKRIVCPFWTIVWVLFICLLLRLKNLQFVGMIASDEFLVLNVMSQLKSYNFFCCELPFEYIIWSAKMETYRRDATWPHYWSLGRYSATAVREGWNSTSDTRTLPLLTAESDTARPSFGSAAAVQWHKVLTTALLIYRRSLLKFYVTSNIHIHIHI